MEHVEGCDLITRWSPLRLWSLPHSQAYSLLIKYYYWIRTDKKKGGMVHQSTENWTNFVRQERLKEEREWFGDGQSLHICPHLATSRSSSDSTRTQPSQAHSSSTSSSQGLAKRKTYLWYRIKENMEGYIWRSFFKTPNNLLSITPTNRTSMGRVLMFFKACRSS